MRTVSLITIHCSASPNDRDLFSGQAGEPGFTTPADVIDGWHKARGFKRDPAYVKVHNPRTPHIGYHFVIARNGALFTGRSLDEIPAHAKGWNKPAIAICMVGTDTYTFEQWMQLGATVRSLAKAYDIPLMPPTLKGVPGKPGQVVTPGVCGHRDLSPDKNGNGKIEKVEWIKTCPGFDVAGWLASGMTPK